VKNDFTADGQAFYDILDVPSVSPLLDEIYGGSSHGRQSHSAAA
jgi:hypothetical protein